MICINSPCILCLFILPFISASSSCPKPSITSTHYIADDGVFHFATAFVVEFSLKCNGDPVKGQIYAEVNGEYTLITKSDDGNTRYQVSWTMEHDKARSGTYKISIYDEDGYAAIRKAERNKEDVSKVSPLETISIEHKGTNKGPWFQSHMLATVFTALVFYLAHSYKAQIMH